MQLVSLVCTLHIQFIVYVRKVGLLLISKQKSCLATFLKSPNQSDHKSLLKTEIVGMQKYIKTILKILLMNFQQIYLSSLSIYQIYLKLVFLIKTSLTQIFSKCYSRIANLFYVFPIFFKIAIFFEQKEKVWPNFVSQSCFLMYTVVTARSINILTLTWTPLQVKYHNNIVLLINEYFLQSFIVF
eukprot:TRINITY_DN4269_c0_g1_i1.p2 TRINITY_DN4269_c0_g1~~TRINITY_DN4269_c0_g1_i1.p2  ORF type:complete len:185 (-),score=-19.27 TRINITY_DN4269_c0_g1_i1:702-1256(-)